jgi:hypothetical protein
MVCLKAAPVGTASCRSCPERPSPATRWDRPSYHLPDRHGFRRTSSRHQIGDVRCFCPAPCRTSTRDCTASSSGGRGRSRFTPPARAYSPGGRHHAHPHGCIGTERLTLRRIGLRSPTNQPLRVAAVRRLSEKNRPEPLPPTHDHSPRRIDRCLNLAGHFPAPERS